MEDSFFYSLSFVHACVCVQAGHRSQFTYTYLPYRGSNPIDVSCGTDLFFTIDLL